ncbi:predicted protein [Streptomyces viridochromogenes DSM 40736]|uniref:Predicted protein n=1 Tax=Streptomyces viridochromogenes (strain DSM 40736 / JCM 4977 / BCRC 1201 / Tue 494) TaxID=591159 RepID=D9X1M1_STRVT|nr:predicted protein [Streptomyces viridochromogenes DSM 40736]
MGTPWSRVSPKVREPPLTCLPLTGRPVHTRYAETIGANTYSRGRWGSRGKMCAT